MITGFTGAITKVTIDSKQVFPGDQKIEIPAGQTMTITINFSATPQGDVAWNDLWTTGVTAKMGTQFGWDPHHHMGGGTKVGSPAIGNLKAPSVKSTMTIKLYGINATNPTAPPG